MYVRRELRGHVGRGYAAADRRGVALLVLGVGHRVDGHAENLCVEAVTVCVVARSVVVVVVEVVAVGWHGWRVLLHE